MSHDPWHDIALRFEAGETTIASPVLSPRDATALRFVFYRWRKTFLREHPNMYDKLGQIQASIEMEPDGKMAVCYFRLPESTRAAQILAQMKAP